MLMYAKVNIWLDDIRPAPDGWLWAKTADECLKMLLDTNQRINILSLDHDLGENEPTGYDLCKKMTDEMVIFPKMIYLHTSNPVGRENMYFYLLNYVDTFRIDSRIFYGFLPWAWEQSMRKSKELGYF